MLKNSEPKARTNTKFNKSGWVRALPSALSAEQVISKGRAAGIKLSKAQVYTIRANARRAQATARFGHGRTATKPGPKGAASPQLLGLTQRFAGLAVDIGLSRADELLGTLRARFLRVLPE